MSATRARFVVAYGALLAVLGGCATADRVAAPGASPGGNVPATALPGNVDPRPASASGVVISQVYGGGGNGGSVYRNDFIELFNAGSAPVTVTGWSVQYASSTGASWQVTTLSGTIAPGRYYLVQQAQGAGGTTPFPTPDATGTIPMSATAGKVALVRATEALATACPLGGAVEDFVGFGTTTNCAEGNAPTPTLSNTTAALRKIDGRQDTDNNAADFATGRRRRATAAWVRRPPAPSPPSPSRRPPPR
jgi:predicted extracellular nuclease